MGDYQALVAYVGVTLVVFVGGLVWHRCRVDIKRWLNMKDYQNPPSDDTPAPHARAAGSGQWS